MSTQFDLEQKIMQCWDIVDDLEVLYTQVLDAPRRLTDDEIANVLLGIKQLYDMKFNSLMSTYEKYLKEVHESKVRDNSEMLRQEKPLTISGY